MKRYYLECKKHENLKKLTEQIPWSHNMLIFSKIKNEEQREWYIGQTAINGWSYDELGFQIKSDLYSRQVLGDKPNNFQNTLQAPQSNLARDMMKDPYILNLSNDLYIKYFNTKVGFCQSEADFCVYNKEGVEYYK